MGNREDLLTAALTCLREKGYARTTARDVAAEAGTSLAAIGYHYGGLRNLLNKAVFSALEEFSDRSAAQLRAEAPADQTYLERFRAVWQRTIDSVQEERAIWVASTMDLFGQIDHVPELRAMVLEGMAAARSGNVALFDNVDEDTVGQDTMRTEGAVYYALMLGVVVQWLIDPETAPSADDVVSGMQAIMANVAASATPARG